MFLNYYYSIVYFIFVLFSLVYFIVFFYFSVLPFSSRRMPGRIIGVSIDAQGNPALRMAMQTREQHIRRDKATSNICTAQALLANMASAYAVYHGPEGLKRIATAIQQAAVTTAEVLEQHGGWKVVNKDFFDTLVLEVPTQGSLKGLSASQIQQQAAEKFGVNVRVVNDHQIGIAMGEGLSAQDLQQLWIALGVDQQVAQSQSQLTSSTVSAASLQRSTPFLTHPVFNSHHTETMMMRYLFGLQRKDLALNTSMISLGSCTMKLNAASEMLPLTWSALQNVHPFAPSNQVQGYSELIQSLEKDLASITGFDAISSQPNSGAQGEYAGLLAIRHYLRHERKEPHRDICLIPKSAHGTNPASASMAGFKVVVVQNDEQGNIDSKDLAAKLQEYGSRVGALMLTYPSTYGLFEEGVKDIIEAVHQAGGLVYMDGANMNAQVGWTSPATIGADVCHLNLHKTFAIPHGGGGPGVGSIGVTAQLAPHLPGHPVVPTGGSGRNVVAKTTGTVSSAPFGSALILPISWMYIKMLGTAGLEESTSMAILNANYMAKRLETEFSILFRGNNGKCGHEFIIDLRPFKAAGVTEEDVAKRLQVCKIIIFLFMRCRSCWL